MDFLPAIISGIGGAASAGAFKGPISTLNNLWYIHYGYKSDEAKQQLIIKKELSIQKYKQDIVLETSKITGENIQEPQLNILGPALEASRYYIEEEQLRGMFAKLISSSMDKSKANLIHGSYVEIIKQMNPLDAKILRYIKEYMNEGVTSFPISKVILRTTSSGGSKRIIPLFFFTDEFESVTDNMAALDNLKRLGLLEITFEEKLADKQKYFEIENSDLAQALEVRYNDSDHKIEFQQGVITLSQYSRNFCKATL